MSQNTIGKPAVVEGMDSGRGTSGHFSYSKSKRHTGKVGSLSTMENVKDRDAAVNKKTVNDKRAI